MTATALAGASNPSQAIYAALNGKSASSATSTTEDAQARFFKLLVTQLKNQDPLNPMDNSQMTSQIAQLNMVDGINKLGTTLQLLLDSANADQGLQAVALVGRGVLVPGSSLSLQSGTAVGGIDLSNPVDNVKVSIKDGSGLVVKTLNLGALEAGSHVFTWDGMTNGGVKAADGNYSIAIDAVQGGKPASADPLAMGVVSSVTNSSQGANLNVGALGVFKMSDVKEII